MNRINRKITVGFLWNLAGLFLARGSTTLFTILIASVLAPEAFGVVAMAMVAFELANAFVTSGLGQALIRSKYVSEIDLSTVFYSNLFLSVIAYISLFVGAPFVAEFYNQPQLTALLQVMGLVVLINASKVVQIAILSRQMNFKAQMQANTIGAVGSGVLAIAAAFSGWAVWSLIVMMLGQALISAGVLWKISKWRPRLEYSFESFRRLFGFGRNLLAEGLLSVLYQNSYVLVIGRFFSAEVTGLYFFAKKISNLVSQQLAASVQQATFPALATIQDDTELLKQKYRQIMQMMMFLVAPVMALIAGLASSVFELLLDKSWSDAVPFLQLLCVVGFLYPIHMLNINLLNVKGRSDLVLKLGFVKKAVNVALLFAAIPYGVIGVVFSQVIGSLLALIPNTYFTVRLINYSLRQQVFDVLKPAIAATIAAYFSFILSENNGAPSIAWLLFGAGAGCFIYLLSSYLLRVDGAIICMKQVKVMFAHW